MSDGLREMFAAAALIGVITRGVTDGELSIVDERTGEEHSTPIHVDLLSTDSVDDAIANAAFRIADSMLRVRANRPPPADL